VRTVRVAFHPELLDDKHDSAVTIARVDVPFTRAVRVVFVRVIGRRYGAATARYVFHALCSTPPQQHYCTS